MCLSPLDYVWWCMHLIGDRPPRSPGVDPKQLAAELQKVSQQQAPTSGSSSGLPASTSATSSPAQPGSPSVGKKRHSSKASPLSKVDHWSVNTIMISKLNGWLNLHMHFLLCFVEQYQSLKMKWCVINIEINAQMQLGVLPQVLHQVQHSTVKNTVYSINTHQ